MIGTLKIYIFQLILFVSMAISIEHVETVISLCTDVELQSSTNPILIPVRISNCLINGHVFLVSEHAIRRELLNETINYHQRLQNYDTVVHRRFERDNEARRKLRAIQRNIIVLMFRLKHFSNPFNIPSFVNLSDERRLRLIGNHLSSLKVILGDVGSITPIISDYTEQTRNISHSNVMSEVALLERNQASMSFSTKLEDVRQLIREQYV